MLKYIRRLEELDEYNISVGDTSESIYRVNSCPYLVPHPNNNNTYLVLNSSCTAGISYSEFLRTLQSYCDYNETKVIELCAQDMNDNITYFLNLNFSCSSTGTIEYTETSQCPNSFSNSSLVLRKRI